MKVLLLLIGISAAAALVPQGYKPYGKYVYNYTANLEVALGPEKEQWTGLKVNATVEFHFLPNYEVLLWIPKTTVSEVVLDPKYSFLPNVTESPTSYYISKYLEIPIKFGYRNGMVNRIFNRADDPLWSVNMKKSIVNLMHVDVMGKDEETGEKLLFTKEEMSVYGICNTTYTMKDFSVFDVNRFVKIGMNITKVIDTSNCTMGPSDFSTSIPTGPQKMKRNPLKTSTIINYNLIGNEIRFKLQQVNATGRFVFVPFSETEGTVVAATHQILTLIRSGGSTIKRDHPEWLDLPVFSTLISPVEKAPIVPQKYDAAFKQNMAKSIVDLLTDISFELDNDVTQDKPINVTLPEIFMRLINYIRVSDTEILKTVWTRLEKEHLKKWFVYSLGLTGDKTCIDFVETKFINKEIPLHMFGEFLTNVGHVGKPTLPWLKKVIKMCSMKIVKEDKYTNQTCVVAVSNIIQSYCYTKKHCEAEIDEIPDSILSYLEFVSSCDPKTMTCWTEAEIMPVLIAAENIGFKSFLPHLKLIISKPHFSIAVRAKAITALRMLIFKQPTQVRMLLFRLYRDVTEDAELRMLAFDILMVNPTPNIIKLCASVLYMESNNEVRGFVLSKINTIVTKLPSYYVGKDIYAACVIAKKLYLNNLLHYMARSQHTIYKWGCEKSKIQVLGYNSVIYTNKTYVPRYLVGGINITLFGNTFTLVELENRFEGLQEFISKTFLPSTNKPEKSFFAFGSMGEPTEQPSTVAELKDLNTKLPVKPRPDEQLKIYTKLRLMNKIVYFNYSTYETKMDWKTLIFKNLIFRAASLESEFKKGKEFNVKLPPTPIEVVYTIPTHIGLPLTLNATVFTIAKLTSKLKAEIKPSLFPSFAGMMSAKSFKRDSVSSSVDMNVTGVIQTLASMYFKLPVLEVGIRFNKTNNFTKCVSAEVKYDFHSKEFKLDYKIPKMNYSFVDSKTELYNYIRPEVLPNTKHPELFHIRKHNITVDHFSTFSIVNGSQVVNKTTRHAVWALKMADSKYLCVVDSVVTTCDKPFYLHVVFHGPHRRLASLYVPGQGFITMSHKSICLFTKETLIKDYPKLFVLDYIHPTEIRLKTLVRMPKEHWPVEWQQSTVDDYMHVKEIEKLYMREMVTMENEEHVEETVYPKNLKVRVVYLNVVNKKVCTTPKKSKATLYKVIVNKTLEEVLHNTSLSTGYCTPSVWGFSFCLHGFYPAAYGVPLIQMITWPKETSLWFHRNETNAPESISLAMTSLESKWESVKLKFIVKLIGTVPERQIVSYSHITRSKEERKLSLVVQPTHKELLAFKKLCFSMVSHADKFRTVASMHDNCEVPHLTLDIVTTKQLPRHQLTWRFNYTYKEMPRTWQAIFNSFGKVFKYTMKKTSTYFYPVNNTNITGHNSTHFTYFLTSPKSVELQIKTDTMTYGYFDMMLPTIVKSFPQGTDTIHLITKLNEYMTPYCMHKNSTFKTFDDVKYNYDLSSGCEHVLIRNCSSNMTNFAVLVKRHPLHQRLRVVTILVDTYKIEVIPNEITAVPTFKINGKEEKLDNDFFMVKPEGKKLIIKVYWEPELHNFYVKYLNGLDLIVELKEGWKIKTRVSPLLTSKTCGLCGNYDMEQTNEFETPEQYVTTDPMVFGHSWLVPAEKCTSGCSMKTDYLEVESKAMKERRMTCLTHFRLPKCLPTCTPKEYVSVKVPTICVPLTYKQVLKTSLTHGEPIEIRSVERYETTVKYPVSCTCPCNINKYPTTKTSTMKGFEDMFTGLFFDY